MRHVSELTTLPQDASEQPTASADRLTEKHIALLWERMAMIYGHRWVSSYGERDDGTWLKGLSDVTPSQIGVGLEKCRDSADEWPPTLPVFRSRCLLREFSAPYHRPFPKLEAPETNPEIALSHLERMKKIFKSRT